jgi:CheY-like chemotaxis protein/anti-sigma regulatory factor (Ser/Thr protein kinase)
LVLVVDDSSIDVALASSLIEQRRGTRVITAASGEAALERIERERPDLVVTDLRMHGMNGLELVETIQQRFSWLPTILMTAHGSEEYAAAALRLGAASYVRKQDLAIHLRETVDEVLVIAGTGRRQERIRTCWTETQFSFCLDNDVSLVHQTVFHFQHYTKCLLRIDTNALTRLGVALHESLTNAILHGNLELDSALREDGSDAFFRMANERRKQTPYCDRRVYVTATESPSQACYVVRDEGPGYDVEAYRHDPTATAQLTKASGRGLFLIHAFMDEVRYNATGNEITMIHKRQPESCSSGASQSYTRGEEVRAEN